MIEDNRRVYHHMQQLRDSSDVCVFYVYVHVGVLQSW